MSLITFSKRASSCFKEIKIVRLISLNIWLQHNHKSEDTIFVKKISRTDLVLSECALQNNIAFLEGNSLNVWHGSTLTTLYFHFFINCLGSSSCHKYHWVSVLQNNRIHWCGHSYPCWGGVRHLGRGHTVVWRNDGMSEGSLFWQLDPGACSLYQLIS